MIGDTAVVAKQGLGTWQLREFISPPENKVYVFRRNFRQLLHYCHSHFGNFGGQTFTKEQNEDRDADTCTNWQKLTVTDSLQRS